MAEQAPSGESAQEAIERAEPWRRLGRRGRRYGAYPLVAIGVILLLDLWVVRGPAERSFLARNIACLRCHVELIPKRSSPAVHRPFLIKACTSCHVPHAKTIQAKVKPGNFSAFDRLRNFLRRVGLQLVWAVLSGPGGLPDPLVKASLSSEEAAPTPGHLRAPVEDLCPACHPSIGPQLAMTFRHPPFVKRQCVSCHLPHASNFARLLRGTDETVCTSCHPVHSELEEAVVHAPFGQLECTRCHKAHASNNAGMLSMPERRLCMGCHEEIRGLDSRSVRHEPFIRRCVVCHRPHSSSNQALLVRRSPDLCYGCHPTIRPEFDLPSAHPVGARLSCNDCHAPHASDDSGLLVAAQRTLCPRCHPQISAELDAPVLHDPFENSPCTSSCHEPHGSRFGPLLSNRDPPLCYGCHPVIRGEVEKISSHPIGSRMRCASCHKPHSSRVYSLLTQPLDGLCYRCHPRRELFGARQKIPGLASTPDRRAGRAPSGGWPDDASARERSPVLTGEQHDEVKCMGCHRPHGSDFTPILKKANPDVCLTCHRTYANHNYHPTRPVYYDPLARKGLTCSSSCHNPHSSPYYRMLRYPYEVGGYGSDHICMLCHTGVGVWY